jgi:hypothetical protein
MEISNPEHRETLLTAAKELLNSSSQPPEPKPEPEPEKKPEITESLKIAPHLIVPHSQIVFHELLQKKQVSFLFPFHEGDDTNIKKKKKKLL